MFISTKARRSSKLDNRTTLSRLKVYADVRWVLLIVLIITAVAVSNDLPQRVYAVSVPAMRLPWDSSLKNITLRSGPHSFPVDWSCTALRPQSEMSGVDFGLPENTPVLAVADGTVVFAGWSGDSDIRNEVIIDHGNGFATEYWHLNSTDPAIVKGVRVKQGTILGSSGWSPTSTGGHSVHLHLEFRQGSGQNWSNHYSAHGISIDNYTIRTFINIADQQGYNYQGTMIRNTPSIKTEQYCGKQISKWYGTNDPDGTLGTVEAKSDDTGGALKSTNVKKTTLKLEVAPRDPVPADVANQPIYKGKTVLHPQRPIFAEIRDSNNQLVFANNGQDLANLNPDTGAFLVALPLPANFNTGIYTVRVKLDYTLWKTVPGIITITKGTNTLVPQVLLTPGDIDQNNAVNILDYNILLDCFSDIKPARNCNDSKKRSSDITDDGFVNQFDYNLLLRIFSVYTGE